jgi:hypothetical protein
MTRSAGGGKRNKTAFVSFCLKSEQGNSAFIINALVHVL